MKRLLLIPGDGIGPEVMTEAKSLLSAISKKYHIDFSLDEVDWGAERWLREGVGIPWELKLIPERFDAILFGALGDPRIPDMAHGRAILLALRTGLDLFINLRPIRLMNENHSVLKNAGMDDIDMVIFRENTQDIYAGAGGSLNPLTTQEVAIDESIHTYHGVKRIVSEAFRYAKKNGRKKVTLVDKANAIRFGGSLWKRVYAETAKEYPDIEQEHFYVDVAAMHMVREPRRFDVIVTSNLFGDILSDLGAGLVGGLGLAASANINPGVMALFEPVHGSAPDIAGRGLANPFAMFLSVAMMLDYLGYQQVGLEIEKAIIEAINAKKTTKDLGGTLTTIEATKYILNKIG
jgi:3-isopropylmalate dehydrogenase